MKIRSFIVIAGALAVLSSCSEGESNDSAGNEPAYTPTANTIIRDSGAANQAAPGIDVQPAASTVALNPAHGEPGHRCEIAVGAPLNSAPQEAAPPVTTTQPLNPVPQPVTPVPNVQPSSPAPSGTASGRVNPAHGQPGHDCNIPVGSPLK